MAAHDSAHHHYHHNRSLAGKSYNAWFTYDHLALTEDLLKIIYAQYEMIK